MYEKGGILLERGSSSCIIKPNIPCKNKKTKRNDKKISKIVYSDKSKEYIKKEMDINNIIKGIEGYKRWAITFDESCKPPLFNKSKRIDDGIHDCVNNISVKNANVKNMKKEQIKKFNKNSDMLIGDYGGETFETYFYDMFEDENKIKNIEKKFLNMMKMYDTLFIGLIELNNNNISHLDIKYSNIILDKSVNKFKYIDFGLSSKYNNLKHFKDRSINEFKTPRIYIWYPLEYLYSRISLNETKKELTNINKLGINEYRKNSDKYDKINKHFNRNSKNIIKNILNNNFKKNNKKNFNNLIKKIDIYSLGMLIPHLFLKNDMLKLVNKSKLLKDFFNLFKSMTEPLYTDRIEIEDAYKEYKNLMGKYKINDKSKSKKKLNKSKKISKKV
jgi:serine/threonine protein kinase